MYFLKALKPDLPCKHIKISVKMASGKKKNTTGVSAVPLLILNNLPVAPIAIYTGEIELG